MTAKVTWTVLTMILVFGCGTKHDDKALTTKDSTTIQESADSDSNVGSVKAMNDFNNSDCIRGQAQSVTKKTVYPNAIFKLNSDKHTGTETVDLKNGERLIINKWGCEYFVLTFRIETERFQADTTDTTYWLDKAAILMNEIQDGINAPLNLQGGIEAIPIQLASMDSRIYELGEEIIFNNDAIRDFVTLNRVQKINEKRFAIEISFATGPL